MKSLRTLLLIWGGAGAALVLYVIVAASVKPGDAGASPISASLLVGEMAELVVIRPPRPAPLAAFTLDGRETTLGEFRGKVLLVNFWATWCAPCLRELPSLDALQSALGGNGFEVVAIAADARGGQAVKEFMARLGVRSLAPYVDERLRLMSALGGDNSLPVTLLIDRRGREIARRTGEADWTSPEAIALIKSVM